MEPACLFEAPHPAIHNQRAPSGPQQLFRAWARLGLTVGSSLPPWVSLAVAGCTACASDAIWPSGQLNAYAAYACAGCFCKLQKMCGSVEICSWRSGCQRQYARLAQASGWDHCAATCNHNTHAMRSDQHRFYMTESRHVTMQQPGGWRFGVVTGSCLVSVTVSRLQAYRIIQVHCHGVRRHAVGMVVVVIVQQRRSSAKFASLGPGPAASLGCWVA